MVKYSYTLQISKYSLEACLLKRLDQNKKKDLLLEYFSVDEGVGPIEYSQGASYLR